MLRVFVLFACLLLSQVQRIRACPIPLYTYNLVSNPTPHLGVGKLAGGWAALGGAGVGSTYSYTHDAAGSSFSASTPCPPPSKVSYLTVDESSSASYKPLLWTSTATTNYWVVSNGAVRLAARAPQGGTLHTASTSPYGFRSDFIACGSDNRLYLQTGTDVPPKTTCQTVSLSIEVYA
ncbi:hypothetical protein FRC03_000459 [Tulasnella sp. 419]|nr:hypothetical protein FRC03_000459 [Tulasnella sp. 419]